ncbi:MAG: SUMF1/EgtB/PvdO family nonheme iron enzyme [Puniceicoccales bacterium]|jgi:formylglycine-generating enzyme required for sulfatase activity|nr:SUMF1/EgtB/PvdO family nonheme iron enzyme [Puniceicoccales bacterium]
MHTCPLPFLRALRALRAFAALALAAVLFAGCDDQKPSKTLADGKLDNAEIAAQLRRSTVVITIFEGMGKDGESIASTGCGFVIGKGIIATNYHVIKDAARDASGALFAIAHLTGQRQEHRIREVLAFDRVTDLAILAVDGLDAPTLPLAPSAVPLKVGEDIFLMDTPAGEAEDTFATGVIFNLAEQHAVSPRIQYSISTAPDNSGGPVLNDHGEVVAIHVANSRSTIRGGKIVRIRNPFHLSADVRKVEIRNFGVPAAALLRLLENKNITLVAATAPSPDATSSSASAATSAAAADARPADVAASVPLAFFSKDIRQYLLAGGSPAELKTYKAAAARLETAHYEKRAIEADFSIPQADKTRRLAAARLALVSHAQSELEAVHAITDAYIALRREVAPPTPQHLVAAETSGDHILLRWDAVPAPAVSYEVSNGDWKETTTAPTLRIANLRPSSEYTFRVRAISKKIHSSAAVLTVKTFVPAPAGLAVVKKATDFILLRWDTVAGAGISYEVSTGDWKQTTDATTLRVPDLKPSSPYTFRIHAIQRNVRSVAATIEATTDALPPGPVVGSPWAVSLPGGVALEMLPVAPGFFTMGSENGGNDEKPTHSVSITKPYWLGKFEVTQAQWHALMGSRPSGFSGAQLPVERVSWSEAAEFCAKLTTQELAAGRLPKGYRYALPTEAQWEYACRAGTTGDYAGSGNRDEKGWHEGNSAAKTHDVGGRSANAWGFFDMHGNVWEWCADWYGNYPSGSVTDPTGPDTGSHRVLRSGSWYYNSGHSRSANRDSYDPNARDRDVGFRLILSFEGGK